MSVDEEQPAYCPHCGSAVGQRAPFSVRSVWGAACA